MFSWLTSPGSASTPSNSLGGGEEWSKIRILVVGDSGVGKTCLVERLVTGKVPTSNPRWTLGCDVSVMVHTTLLGGQTEKKVLVEFWDVGGHRNYADSRAVFYHQINGVILVHDATNRKSFTHLKAWLDELEREDQLRKSRGLVGVEESRFGSIGKRESISAEGAYRAANPPQHLQQQQYHRRSSAIHIGPLDGLPILVVGNKTDLGRSNAPPPKLWSFDSVLTSALSPSRDLPDHEKISAFFQKVFERRHGHG